MMSAWRLHLQRCKQVHMHVFCTNMYALYTADYILSLMAGEATGIFIIFTIPIDVSDCPEHGGWSFYLITHVLSLSSSLSVSMSLFPLDLMYLLYFLYFLLFCLMSHLSLKFVKGISGLLPFLFSFLFSSFLILIFPTFLTFFCISSLLSYSHVKHPFIFLSISHFISF
jgi:hypothetical protein